MMLKELKSFPFFASLSSYVLVQVRATRKNFPPLWTNKLKILVRCRWVAGLSIINLVQSFCAKSVLPDGTFSGGGRTTLPNDLNLLRWYAFYLLKQIAGIFALLFG